MTLGKSLELTEPQGPPVKWLDEYILLAGTDEEERIWWEHFIMIELSVIHGNKKSECRESLGKRPSILLPLRSHKAPLAISYRQVLLCSLCLSFVMSGCDSNSFAVFGLFRKLFWFLSPESFFPLYPAPPPPCHHHSEIVM